MKAQWMARGAVLLTALAPGTHALTILVPEATTTLTAEVSVTTSTVVSCSTTTNVVQNPSFEDGFTDWGYASGTTGSVVAGDAPDGSYYLESSGSQTRAGILFYQYLENMESGSTYTASLDWRVKPNSEGAALSCRLYWYMNSFGSSIGSTSATVTSSGMQWTTFSTTFTPTSSGQHLLEIYSYCQQSTAVYTGNAIDIDNIQMSNGQAITSCSTSTMTVTITPTPSVATSTVVTTSVPALTSSAVVLSSSSAVQVASSAVSSAAVSSAVSSAVPSSVAPSSVASSPVASSRAASTSVASTLIASSPVASSRAASSPTLSTPVTSSPAVLVPHRSSTAAVLSSSSAVSFTPVAPSSRAIPSSRASVPSVPSSRPKPSSSGLVPSLSAIRTSPLIRPTPIRSPVASSFSQRVRPSSIPVPPYSSARISPAHPAGISNISHVSPGATHPAGGSTISTGTPPQLTTSTVLTTRTATITACPSSITDCPARSKTTFLTTETLVVSTTVCPLTEIPTAVPTAGPDTEEHTTSTVLTTRTSTITACPTTVPNCPASAKSTYVTTETLVVSSTVYLVTPAHSAGSTESSTGAGKAAGAGAGTPPQRINPSAKTEIIDPGAPHATGEPSIKTVTVTETKKASTLFLTKTVFIETCSGITKTITKVVPTSDANPNPEVALTTLATAPYPIQTHGFSGGHGNGNGTTTAVPSSRGAKLRLSTGAVPSRTPVA
ncbi:hypothetical protein BO71DRAFT_444623 [Aspergillus ellipticus CBS 707.79]|uniref:CBM-cenC domain-containing protein n=1 Tax=Aspergillus ellipticus CBS 707.79 TaxID=1448320 RepID=A0A319EE81_9EURO|nr:hypothetical protein BO71DRAFT_444623 [Aspergillus ellipticus CBS 707.79]